MLIVPAQQTIVENVNGKEVARLVRNAVYLLPARLDMSVDLKLQDEPRYVGIYAVPVYLSSMRLQGEFDFSALRELAAQSDVTYLWAQSRIRLPLSTVSSLREIKNANFAGEQMKLGPATAGVFGGIEARHPMARLPSRKSPVLVEKAY